MTNDPYDDVLPEDLPPLAEVTDAEAAEMAEEWEPSDDDGMTDAEADADTLRMAGMGTDEDYSHGDDFSVWDDHLIGGDSDLMGEA